MKTEADMPRYRSHKTVQALEIASINKDKIDATFLSFVDKNFDDIEVPAELLLRYKPVPGDFLVVYADGYKSFSPRKAFLEGYTRETEVYPTGSQT